jgi:hypothetical protein
MNRLPNTRALVLTLGVMLHAGAHADDVKSTVDVLIEKCWNGLRLTPQSAPQTGIQLLGQDGVAVFDIEPDNVPAFQRKLNKELGDLAGVVGPERAASIKACMAPYVFAAKQAIVTEAPAVAPVMAPAPSVAAAPVAVAATPMGIIEPEPGALGRLVTNASLISDATWSPEPSRVNRLLNFEFHVEARPTTEAAGLINVTLTRSGKDVCTVSLNTKTSPASAGVHWGVAYCSDSLLSQADVQYKTRVQATEMVPIKVVLTRVDAVRK